MKYIHIFEQTDEDIPRDLELFSQTLKIVEDSEQRSKR